MVSSKVQNLMNCFHKHLPSTRRKEDNHCKSETYARLLIMLLKNPEVISGRSQDAEKLSDLRHSAIRFSVMLDGLGDTSRRVLSGRMKTRSDDNATDDSFATFAASLQELILATEEMGKTRVFARQANAKRNWRALAATHECRKLWAIEHWISDPEKYGPPPRELVADGTPKDQDARRLWEQHLRDYAPKFQNHNRPGPFGRFLEDIMEVTGILANDGNPVSAATALQNLRDFEGK